MAPDALGHLEVWFVTGSQELYGDGRRCGRSTSTRARSPRARRARPTIPVRVVHKAVATSAESIRARAARGERRATVRRRDRLDAHVLAGEDVDRRAHARCRSRSSICTRSSIAICPGRRSTWTS